MNGPSLTEPGTLDFQGRTLLTTSEVKCAHCASDLVAQSDARLTDGGVFVLLVCGKCHEHTCVRVHEHKGGTLVQAWRAKPDNVALRKMTP